MKKYKIHLFIVLFLGILFCSCNLVEGDKTDKETTWKYNDLTVTFVKQTRVTTFIKDGKPIDGIVVQKLKNGGKNTWMVEKGLATKQTLFYPNGNIERSLEMKNGVEHGHFLMYFQDGSKYVEQYYNEGEAIGTWYRWNKKGELLESIEH
jgi:antitoxin component YwqK of YwqJK toxin-antitoxin module